MLVLIVAGFLIFHVVLGYALITQRLNAMYILAAAFAFAAPVSTGSFAQVQFIKYGRIYSTLLIVIVGVLILRLYRLGPAAIAMSISVFVYFIAAVWSDDPLVAVAYKGLFAATFLSGLILCNATHSIADFKHGMRLLAIAGAAFAAFILLELVRNPGAIAHIGRLFAFGINPNRIGHTAAPMLIISLFLVLYESNRFWKSFGYALASVLTIIILYTGSRGALGMAGIGAAVLALPMSKRPFLFATVSVVLLGTLYFGLGLIERQARERIGQISLDNRQGVWSVALERFSENPVFGAGWVYNRQPGEGASTRNMHSIYMQTLAEAGAFGIFILFAALVFIGSRAFHAWRYVVQIKSLEGCAYLMIGLLAAILAHGFVESATFVGTTVSAMMLGWAIGMVDRLPLLAQEHVALETPCQDVEWIDDQCDVVEADRLLAPQ